MEEFLYNKIRYVIVNNYAAVVGYDKRYSNLTRVSLPEKVEYKGETFPVCSIQEHSFVGIEMTTLDLPKTMQFINLTALMCPVKGDDIYDDILLGPKRLAAINVASGNPVYSSVDGVLYTKDKSELLFCPMGKYGKLKIPRETVKISNNKAIPGWGSRITSAEMPNTFTTVGTVKHFLKDKTGKTIQIDNVPVKIYDAEVHSLVDRLFAVFGL